MLPRSSRVIRRKLSEDTLVKTQCAISLDLNMQIYRLILTFVVTLHEKIKLHNLLEFILGNPIKHLSLFDKGC